MRIQSEYSQARLKNSYFTERKKNKWKFSACPVPTDFILLSILNCILFAYVVMTSWRHLVAVSENFIPSVLNRFQQNIKILRPSLSVYFVPQLNFFSNCHQHDTFHKCLQPISDCLTWIKSCKNIKMKKNLLQNVWKLKKNKLNHSVPLWHWTKWFLLRVASTEDSYQSKEQKRNTAQLNKKTQPKLA